jgi:hypothetical protein
MSGSSVFAYGSTPVTNDSIPADSAGSAIVEWSLLGGWTSGLFFVQVTAYEAGAGDLFAEPAIGLCPVNPATGEWVDVLSPSDGPVVTGDGGYIKIPVVPLEYAAVFPVNGNAYQVVFYANPGSSMTLSAALIVHD